MSRPFPLNDKPRPPLSHRDFPEYFRRGVQKPHTHSSDWNLSVALRPQKLLKAHGLHRPACVGCHDTGPQFDIHIRLRIFALDVSRSIFPAKNRHQISRHSDDGQLADCHPKKPLQQQQKSQVEAPRGSGKNEPPKNLQHSRAQEDGCCSNILGLTRLIDAKPCYSQG